MYWLAYLLLWVGAGGKLVDPEVRLDSIRFNYHTDTRIPLS